MLCTDVCSLTDRVLGGWDRFFGQIKTFLQELQHLEIRRARKSRAPRVLFDPLLRGWLLPVGRALSGVERLAIKSTASIGSLFFGWAQEIMCSSGEGIPQNHI